MNPTAAIVGLFVLINPVFQKYISNVYAKYSTINNCSYCKLIVNEPKLRFTAINHNN